MTASRFGATGSSGCTGHRAGRCMRCTTCRARSRTERSRRSSVRRGAGSRPAPTDRGVGPTELRVAHRRGSRRRWGVRGRPSPAQAGPRRLHLPAAVRQLPPSPHGRRASAFRGEGYGSAARRRRTSRTPRHRATDRSPAVRALRRRAAAGGIRPGPGDRREHHRRRRTYRRARRCLERSRARSGASLGRRGCDVPAGDARSGGDGDRRRAVRAGAREGQGHGLERSRDGRIVRASGAPVARPRCRSAAVRSGVRVAATRRQQDVRSGRRDCARAPRREPRGTRGGGRRTRRAFGIGQDHVVERRGRLGAAGRGARRVAGRRCRRMVRDRSVAATSRIDG